LRPFEGRPPDRIGKGRGRRVETFDAAVDDGAGAIDAREKRGGEVRTGGGEAAPGGLENGVAFRMLHPDETAVTFMAFIEVANAGRKGVAGGDLGAVPHH